MSTLDDALEILKDTGPEYRGGLSNHGPMAAEALASLGRKGDVVAWTERYRKQLLERPPRRQAIPRKDFRDAMGDFSRFADWVTFFEEELKETDWRAVLGRFSGELAPGFIGVAAHGIIRVGHAARGLAAEDTVPRRRELVDALAYWASRYQTLPENHEPSSGLIPSQALAHLELLPERLRKNGSLITTEVADLAGFPPFAKVPDLVDASAEPAALLSDLTETFARMYLEHVEPSGSVIALLHAVTGPAAVRSLLPVADRATAALLLRYAWQGAAALYMRYGAVVKPSPAAARKTTWEEVVERSVQGGDEHAIKLCEVCRSENAIRPSPVYLAAADDASRRLGREQR